MQAANTALADNDPPPTQVDTSPHEFAARLTALSGDLTRRAVFLTGGRQEAEDLVQATILKALAGRHRFRQGSNLRGWTMSIMQNLFLDACRRRSCRIRVGDTISATPSDDSLGPLDLLSLKDVEAALQTLTVENRRLFRLAHFDNQPQRAIAAVTGLPEGTLATRLFRARKRLRAELTRTYQAKLALLKGAALPQRE